jgi:hypothetical protein
MKRSIYILTIRYKFQNRLMLAANKIAPFQKKRVFFFIFYFYFDLKF